MKYLFVLLLFLCVTTNLPLHAQGEYALPFMILDVSAELGGSASAFTGLPAQNFLAVDANPAQLGHLAKNHYFGASYSKVSYLPDYGDVYLSSGGFFLGYDLSHAKADLPLSVGVGFTQRFFYLGKNVWTDEYGNELGTFESKEWYSGFHVGLRWERYVRFSLGYSAKNYTSALATVSIDAKAFHPEGWAHDFGVLLEFPFSSYLPSLYRSDSGNQTISPLLNVSTGAALLNMGDPVWYIDKTQTDPLPRQAKIGIGLTTGFTLTSGKRSLRLLYLSYSSEANDFLIERHPDGSFGYQNFPGDIQIITHVLTNHGDAEVQHRRGLRLEVGEIFTYSWGLYSSSTRNDVHTYGYVFSARGFLKSLSFLFHHPIIDLALKRLDLKYQYASYRFNGMAILDEFRGVTVSVHTQ